MQVLCSADTRSLGSAWGPRCVSLLRPTAHGPQVFYSVDTSSRTDAELLVKELNAAGLVTVDMSKNELAKAHVR